VAGLENTVTWTWTTPLEEHCSLRRSSLLRLKSPTRSISTTLPRQESDIVEVRQIFDTDDLKNQAGTVTESWLFDNNALVRFDSTASERAAIPECG
jgi:hypothetical protein